MKGIKMGYFKIYALVSTFILIFSGCSPVYISKLDSNYTGTKITDASLAIAPIDSITVDYTGDVKDEFGEGDKTVLIEKHFREVLLSALKVESSFKDVVYGDYSEQPKFSEKSYDLGDVYKLHVDIPADSNQIKFQNSNPDFILFIQDLYIGIEYYDSWSLLNRNEDNIASSYSVYSGNNCLTENDFGNTGGVNYQMPIPSPMPNPAFSNMYYGTSKSKYLIYKFKFYFWDNKKHRVVTYGRILSKSKAEDHALGMVEIIRINNWYEIDGDMIFRLLDRTPFRKNK
jgi:hypothetical protein